MEIFNYLAFAFIGASLGLVGAGGSILTMPVLVYLFKIPPLLATSYSLFIVGITSLLAAIEKARQAEMQLKPALTFGLVSMGVVMVIRHFIIPMLPKSGYNLIALILFAILMILAAFSMIRKKYSALTAAQVNWLAAVPYTILIGLVTGFLGAGGGFLLIPVLTQLLAMDMKKAVGTSLAVIAINSLAGFVSDIKHVYIHWQFLSAITLIALAGALIGVLLCRQIKSNNLKLGFGWFVLVLGVAILGTEFLSVLK